MSDQLRNNAGKLALEYVYANQRAVLALAADKYVADGSRPTLGDVQRALLAYTSGASREYLTAATMSLLCYLEDQLNPEGFILSTAPDDTTLLDFPYAWAEYLAVLKFGETKYARGNYRLGAPITQYLGCGWRHATAHDAGETFDPDALNAGFKVRHLGSLLWNLIQALEQPDCRDDRLPATQFGPYDRTCAVVPEGCIPAVNDYDGLQYLDGPWTEVEL